MKHILSTYLLIFLLTVAKEVFPQTQQVNFNLVSGSNGVSLGKINGMTRDNNGLMWFSDQTNHCIVRYDGNEMVSYKNDPKNTNSLGGNYPECLFADSSGIIWIGFYGMGLDRFDPETNTFTHYLHQKNNASSLSNDSVTAILIDHSGNFWVGNRGGLDLFNSKTGEFKHYHNIPGDSGSLSYNNVRAVYEDKAGTIWVGTGFVWENNDEGGLNQFHRETGTFTRYMHDPKNPYSLVNNKVRAIFEDSKGNFWVGTAGDGLHLMDRKKGIFQQLAYNPAKPEQLSRPPLKTISDHITFITEDALENLWIGTLNNGLVRYDLTSKKLTHFGYNADNSTGFKDFSGWWAFSSPDGVFWVSTQENNLYKVDIFTNNIPRYALDKGTIFAFHEEPSVMWFATDEGIFQKELKTASVKHILNDPLNSKSIGKNVVYKIFKDSRRDFWFPTDSGLYQYKPATKSLERFSNNVNDSTSLSSNDISLIYEDKQLNLWVGTFGGGLNKLDRNTGTFNHYKNISGDTNSLNNGFISSVIEENEKLLWVGNYNNSGINKMDKETGKCKHYLPGLDVVCIYRDLSGKVWVGTENGLYYYDKNSDHFSSLSENHAELSISQIRSMIADDENNLWIATPLGIYRINQKRDQLIFYGKDNGVYTEFMPYAACYKGLDGKIYFGSLNSYFSFYPSKIKMSPAIPKVALASFWVNGQLVKPGRHSPIALPVSKVKEVNLKYNQSVFSISFTALDYSNSSSKKVFYKLENYDNEWRQPTNENKVYYFNVPQGKYNFRIKAVNTINGIVVEKSIVIIISPPWWSTWWAYCLYAIVFFTLVFSVHRYQKERLIKAERERAKTKELAQAKEIEKAYHQLRTTQSQLIQSEKMASLGELTAGIAHEIQNPLNFVNNFSEVNTELISEMNDEIDRGNLSAAKSIAKEIEVNEQKINHHGKRADAIVKGMLQHSRKSEGTKEPTDINALCDEYLRLSYHGLRAKDKSFNAEFKTDFDETISNINIIPQDIGRVLLNLYNNAFYAVAEKKKGQGESFDPIVSVSTKKMGDTILIGVKDNGNGIQQKIVDKIFQPFFTTKPTGQGTGLGLSLSYDIIKAHGGEIKVETKEGEGSEFFIYLPLQNQI